MNARAEGDCVRGENVEWGGQIEVLLWLLLPLHVSHQCKDGSICGFFNHKIKTSLSGIDIL